MLYELERGGLGIEVGGRTILGVSWSDDLFGIMDADNVVSNVLVASSTLMRLGGEVQAEKVFMDILL